MRITGLVIALGSLSGAWYFYFMFDPSPRIMTGTMIQNSREVQERTRLRDESMWFLLGSSAVGALLYGFSPRREKA